MDAYQKLLHGNIEWVKEKLSEDKDFFTNLAAGQHPDFLWIGCSDSRVAVDQITKTNPGELFVHRNIANLVVHTDLNMLSVLYFAISELQIKHIIVCGHYGCGGILAALQNDSKGLINNWIRNIKDVYVKYEEELDKIPDLKKKSDRLVELNVIEQVYNLAKTHIVQEAWKKKQIKLHGWVFSLETGLLKDLNVATTGPETINAIYRFDNL